MCIFNQHSGHTLCGHILKMIYYSCHICVKTYSDFEISQTIKLTGIIRRFGALDFQISLFIHLRLHLAI